MKKIQENDFAALLVKITNLVGLMAFTVIILLLMVIILRASPSNLFLPDLNEIVRDNSATAPSPPETDNIEGMWRAPDLATLAANTEGDQIRYGRELVKNTAQYLGPKGSVLQISNGMNCQNCHLEAGTKLFGNNYSLVASTYPKVRARSGKEEDVVKRVNDCFERSLNGTSLKRDSKEMQAMVAYIKWVGKDIKKGEKVKGAGLIDIDLLDRPANPVNGKAIYLQKCQSCHGQEGDGKKQPENVQYQYPPLWGKNSYNDGAGLYRISNFAKYVKANMPLGATFNRPQLTDEEAWDLAAFVNSMPRPNKKLSTDWPDISKKPFDHPFGPYTDKFSEQQHKYGPYKPIIATKY